MRRHLGPAVAAHGQNGDALALGRVGQRVQVVQGDRQCRCHKGVGQIGLRGDQRARPARCRTRRPLASAALAVARVGGEMPHGDGAGFAALRCRRGMSAAIAAVRTATCGMLRDRLGQRLGHGRGQGRGRLRSRHRRSCGARGRSRRPGCCGSGRRQGRARSVPSASRRKMPPTPAKPAPWVRRRALIGAAARARPARRWPRSRHRQGSPPGAALRHRPPDSAPGTGW